MKKLVVILPLLVVLSAVFSGCAGHRVIPERDLLLVGSVIAYDDVLPAPGGYIYRANFHNYAEGEVNLWPPVEFTQVRLLSRFEKVVVGYRDYIETRVGETRHNIFMLDRRGGLLKKGSLRLYATSVPSGFRLGQYVTTGQMGLLSAVLIIGILPDVAVGRYELEIGLEVEERYYGTVTCIIGAVASV